MDTSEIAEAVAQILEESAAFTLVDWNDLGEVTLQAGGRTFRATFVDITDDEE
ncbi:hypothetical protein NKH10_19415 [Mesorhizobium sp. M1340]|uniref:hypothetical protein n=1 Tax=Mesorhizobium sp. M1340 TaxID=2957087 RepID=UPI00333D5CEE